LVRAIYLFNVLTASRIPSYANLFVRWYVTSRTRLGEPEITRVVLWPAWLVAEHKVPDVAQDVERDPGTAAAADSAATGAAEKDQDAGQSEDARRRRRALRRQLRDKKRGLRTVCCYGDGRFMKVGSFLFISTSNP
jgi:hypothetical protein